METNYKYFIAKTIEGSEFIHSKKDAYFVSTAGRLEICKALNDAKYQLKAGEKWHIYKNDWYTETFIYRVLKRRNGRIYSTYA